VYVKVTVVVPPVAGGAPVLLFVSTPLQPPLALTVPSQVLKAALICACVCPKGSVWLVGQVKITGGGAETVKVAWQVWVSGAQVLNASNVTVFTSPQLEGEKLPLLLPVTLQPPFVFAVFIQLE
jgi:hypothetical protein